MIHSSLHGFRRIDGAHFEAIFKQEVNVVTIPCYRQRALGQGDSAPLIRQYMTYAPLVITEAETLTESASAPILLNSVSSFDESILGAEIPSKF